MASTRNTGADSKGEAGVCHALDVRNEEIQE